MRVKSSGWLAVLFLAACEQSACQPEGLGPDGLPQELTLTVDGPVTVDPGGESAPVRVRAVCPRCNIDWSPWEFALVGPADGTPAQGARFAPAFADWETQLTVLGNADGPRGEQPEHRVKLRRRQPVAGRPAESNASAPVAITVTGGSFTLVPRPAAIELTRGLALIAIEVERQPGFVEPVQVLAGDVLSTVPGATNGFPTVEALDGQPTDLQRFLVREENAGETEYRANFSASAGGTRRTTSVTIGRVATPPAEALSVATEPTSVLLRPGTSLTVDVTAQRRSGFAGPVSFATAGLPDGVAASFAPATSPAGLGPATSTMTLTATATAPADIARPSVIASGGALVAAFRFQVTVPGRRPDAGPDVVFDGGDEPDAGQVELDAGSLADAGAPLDAGSSVDAGVADGGSVDAGIPGNGPNLVACECNDFSIRRVCATENCLGTGSLYTFCQDVCGDAGLFSLPSCVTSAPLCVGEVDAGIDAGVDAGVEGTNLIECPLDDGGVATLCTNISCRGFQALGQLSARCSDAFGTSVNARSCAPDAVQCGGSGTTRLGSAFSCQCFDGRLLGVCSTIGECTGLLGLPLMNCHHACEDPLSRAVILACVDDALVCPPGVVSFPVDAGDFDAGFDAGIDAGDEWGVVQLAAGWTHICALTDAGTVWCWGQNPRLTPTPTQLPGPTRVAGLPPATQLASTNGATCALTAEGDVWCFGSNDTALNMNPQPDGGLYGPRTVDAGLRFARLAGGGSTICGLNPDGGLFCWGGNTNGALGRGFLSAEERVPRAPDGGGPWAFVSSGQQHSCALDFAGGAWCWGLQSPVTTYSAFPLDGGRTFSSLSAGFQHTCGLEQSSALPMCWGNNPTSQLGVHWSVSTSRVPLYVDGGLPSLSLTTGSGFSCAVADGGVAFCWGSNANGVLGGGLFTPSIQTAATPVSTTRRFVSLSAGSNFVCGLDVDARIWCWGANTNSALGRPSTALGNRASPLEVFR